MRRKPILIMTFMLFLFMALVPTYDALSAGPSELFFSEYIEGSSYNKAIEIYNGTGAAVDLSAYTLELYSNGAASPSQSAVLSGTLADGDVFVIAHGDADAAILAEADDTNNSVINFNGDDALVLRNNGLIVDSFGQVGVDPGYYWGVEPTTTQNHTLRRKETICAGDTDGSDAFDPALEWDGYAIDTFDGFGTHTATCGGPTYTPIYDIQYTADASGDSPLAGQVVTTEGIVTMVLSDGYYLEDPAGGAWNGLWVYGDSAGLALGDRVNATGTIDEYYNLTELKDLTASVVVSSGNPVPAPVLLATADVSQEQWEGVLVQVQNLTVTSLLTYGEWTISDGSGDVVVDDKGSYVYAPTVGDALISVTGPLDYSYSAFKIQPRDDGDIVIPTDYTPIYDIQYTADPGGESPLHGQVVTTEGIVTMVLYNGYYVEDPVGGPWSGLWVYDSSGPVMGDRVRITGEVEEYYDDLTEMINLSEFAVLTSGNPIPAPEVLATADVSQEQWEGVLVQVQNVMVTNEDLGYGEWSVDDTSGDVRVDDKGSYTYVPANGDFLLAVTGPVDFGFGAYKIQPRDDGDIVMKNVVINEFLADPAGDLTGDANGDGLRDSSQDEFVEIVNISNEAVDLSGWTLADGYSVRHEFPAGSVIPAYCNLVVFGGGTPTGSFGGALVQTASGGSLGLNNSGDTITLNTGVFDMALVTYGTEGGYNQSLTRDPDTSGDFVLHSEATGSDGALFSPGTQIDGTKFLGCNTAVFGVCGDAATPIHVVQGDGAASPLAGMTNVTVEGVVVGDFQESDQLRGFYLQEEDSDADADPATSEGVFVYEYYPTLDVNKGDIVRLQGLVTEYYGLTQIKTLTNVEICGAGGVASPAVAALPVASQGDFEAVEGMVVTFPQPLTISEYYYFGRYGELALTDGRQYQPTAVYDPYSPEAEALALANPLGRITLDDGRTSSNPDPAIHPNGYEFTLENLFRGGDQVQNLTGVVDYNYGAYKVHAVQGADYIPVNLRTEVPDDVGGGLKVASFNVLNYFTTIDTGDDICGPNADMGCRGADTEEEFARQRAKIISATLAIDADVVGLIEIENHPTDEAVQDLVNGLNDVAGAGTYAYVATGPVGTDAIKVAFIYQPAKASLVGGYAVLDDPAFTNPMDYETPKTRAALAQTFMDNDTGGVFTAVVNHLKSKGSECDFGEFGDDDPDVQGNCNLTRTLGAIKLAEWLATDPTGSGDADFLIIGDLNAYDKEDPIYALLDAGYSDLLFDFLGEYAYSYVFDGQLGYLDHALANLGLLEEVSGVTVWHINTDEPNLIDYDMSYKQDAQDALYASDAYRSSDHDPVIVGLDVCDEIAPSADVRLSKEILWPPNHQMVKVKTWVDALDNFDSHPTYTLVSVTSNEPDDGLGDGDKPDDIIIINRTQFKLRAERSGLGEGRIYTITYQIMDDCGNTSLVSVEVLVPHSAPKK